MSVFAAEPAPARKTDITITGDVEFGVCLLKDAGSVEYVKPYFDTGCIGFRRFAAEASDGTDAIMLKDPFNMTEGEMVSLINQPDYFWNGARTAKVWL